MEKTVIVLTANSLSSTSCGHSITFELTQGGRAAKSSASKVISKTIWTCCVEGVLEYCRVVFDLFPDECQVCVAAVDEGKCQPVNSWRDEDQAVTKVQNGFQKFGCPVFLPPQGAPAGRGHLNPCLQGLQYAVRCLAQLTATQYAVTSCPGIPPPPNQGRIIFLCSLRSENDVRELEKAIVTMVRGENSDIKTKQDHARLCINQCQLVLINTYSPATSLQSEIKDSPLTQLSSQVSSVVYSFPARVIHEKCIHLTKVHFNLRSTIITGIPMKEEQSGGNSANYDVELIHLAEAHRDVLRASYGLSLIPSSRKDSSNKDVVLKWSTPKSTSLELQKCTSAYRVTPSDVTSRPTICLINFVLSGKPVLLEQPRKNSAKIISHLLTSHAGAIYLHCIPLFRNHLDDPPSISEGWGGRITDYRISDFSDLVKEHLLVPTPVDRTKIPLKYPQQTALDNLNHATRHWPMVYADTLVYTLKQDLDCLPALFKEKTMSESQLDQCRKVIINLHSKEIANEQLSIPNVGGRNKGFKRDEQYRALWTELENLAHVYSSNSEKHGILLDFLLQTTSRCPSMHLPRKTPTTLSAENGSSTTPAVAAKDQPWKELDGRLHKDRTVMTASNLNKNTELTWNQEPDSQGFYVNPTDAAGASNSLPTLAKPGGSLLSIWTKRKQAAASSCHSEFVGRVYGDAKSDLYKKMKSSSACPVPDQDH